MRGGTAAVVGAGYALALAGLTLTPIGRVLNRLTVRLYLFGLYDLGLPRAVLPEHYGYLLNVVLFVPFGLLLLLVLRRSWASTVALGAAVSASVELVQLIPWLGRDMSIGDVLTNVLGTAVGATIGAVLRRRGAGRWDGGEGDALG